MIKIFWITWIIIVFIFSLFYYIIPKFYPEPITIVKEIEVEKIVNVVEEKIIYKDKPVLKLDGLIIVKEENGYRLKLENGQEFDLVEKKDIRI